MGSQPANVRGRRVAASVAAWLGATAIAGAVTTSGIADIADRVAVPVEVAGRTAQVSVPGLVVTDRRPSRPRADVAIGRATAPGANSTPPPRQAASSAAASAPPIEALPLAGPTVLVDPAGDTFGGQDVEYAAADLLGVDVQRRDGEMTVTFRMASTDPATLPAGARGVWVDLRTSYDSPSWGECFIWIKVDYFHPTLGVDPRMDGTFSTCHGLLEVRTIERLEDVGYRITVPADLLEGRSREEFEVPVLAHGAEAATGIRMGPSFGMGAPVDVAEDPEVRFLL